MHALRLSIVAPFTTALLVAPVASADDAPLRLTWTAPEGCPSGEEVRRRALAEENAAREEGARDRRPLEADARVERAEGAAGGDAWRVVIRTRRGEAVGERIIEASTCEGVAEATSVLLSLALMENEPDASAPPASAPPAPMSPSPVEERSPPAPAPERPSLALGVQAALDTATLPSLAAGGGLTLAWTPGRARLEIEAIGWAAQSRTVEGTAAGARFSMASAGLRGCWRCPRGVRRFAVCGDERLLVSARGYGADANYDATAQSAAVTAGALGRWVVTPWLAARLRLDAFAPLARPRFIVERVGPVHRAPALGAAASFGVEVLFL